MVLISYDISDDKLRAKFAKDLSKYGFRLQYSLFQIKNSERILHNIVDDIENKYSKKFSQSDSIMIFKLNPNCEIHRFGYAKNDESDVIVLG